MPLPNDEAARAHACRFAYEVRELGRVDVSAQPEAYESHHGEARRIEAQSGEVRYVVRSVEAGNGLRDRFDRPARRWEISDGTHVVVVGESVDGGSTPQLVPDGAGAILVGYQELETWVFPFVLVVAGQVAYRGAMRFREEQIRLTPRADGWLLVRYDSGDEGIVVSAIGRDGSITGLAQVGDRGQPAGSGVAVERDGRVAIAFVQDGRVRFTPDSGVHVVDIDEDHTINGSLSPMDLIEVDDGWWLVIGGSWQSHHFAAAPEDFRFVHLDPSGEPTDRAEVRFGDDRVGYAGGLRIEDGELRARFIARRGRDQRIQIDVAVVHREPCPPAPLGPCDPRTWPADGVTRARDGRLVAEGHVEERVSRRREPHPMLRNIVGLGADELARACIADAGDPLAAVPTQGELAVYGADGAQRLSIDGGWTECELVSLPDRIVLAAARVDSLTSGGPITSIEVFVLSSDARRLIDHHVPASEGRGLHSLADEEGVVLVWSEAAHWHYTSWRLDREGRPRTSPRRFATIYGFPEISLEQTALGPGLVWSRWDERGFVPLCHRAPD